MVNLSLRAEIDHGRITVEKPERLPITGKALLTVLNSSEPDVDWEKVMRLLGAMRNKVDGLALEREARDEWDEPEGEHTKRDNR